MALPIFAGFIREMEKSPQLKYQVDAEFEALPEDLQRQLACKDYKQHDNFIEWLFGNKKDKNPDKAEQPDKKKKGFFSKLKALFE